MLKPIKTQSYKNQSYCDKGREKYQFYLNPLQKIKSGGKTPVPNAIGKAHAKPKTFRTPYTSPAMAPIVSKPQRATSPVVQPLVLVSLTVLMKTPERTTTPSVKDIMPTIKLAMIHSPQ